MGGPYWWEQKEILLKGKLSLAEKIKEMSTRKKKAA